MNNFDNWKAGLTVDDLSLPDMSIGFECATCPATETCGLYTGECVDIFKRWAESEYIPPTPEKNKVEQLADLLGVVVDEPFNVRWADDGNSFLYNPCSLTSDGHIKTSCPTVGNSLIGAILTGAAVIEKIPQQPEEWKPKVGQQGYWFILPNGTIASGLWYGNEADLAKYAFGNCFPTEEAAEAGRAGVMAKFEAIRAEIREC